MWSKCLTSSSLKCVRMGLCRKSVLTKKPSSEWSSVPVPASSFATSQIARGRDPFEELLNEIQMNQASKASDSKMFTQDPPISIKDIDGKPLEPIDINAWADPNELSNLFGNMDFLQKKLLTNEYDISKALITKLDGEESELVIEPSSSEAAKLQEEEEETAEAEEAVVEEQGDGEEEKIDETTNESAKESTNEEVNNYDIGEAEKQAIVKELMESLEVKTPNPESNKQKNN